MAATEQLKELGEKLQAVAPAPADELTKLLEVRPREGYPQASPLWSAANLRVMDPAVWGGLCVDLWLRRDNSAGLGFRLLDGKVLVVGFPVRIWCSGC